MRSIRVAMAVLVSSWCGALLAEEPVLQLRKPVLLPELAEETLVAVPLDSEVYAATQEDLDDLRVRDREGRTVPFLLRRVPVTGSRVEQTVWTPQQRTVRPLEDGGLEITVELEDEEDRPLPNGLTLVTPLINFEQRVRVETSVDGTTWEPAADEVIFDYTQYMDARSVSVPFPSTERRFFRITIDDVTAEQQSRLLELTRTLQGDEETQRTERLTIDRRPFRIDRIEFWRKRQRAAASGAVRSEYPVESVSASEDEEAQRTIVEVTTRREPLTLFRLQSPSRHFSRRAEVQVESVDGARPAWRTIGEATLSRIDFQSLQQEQLEVRFPETRAERYRIVIDNRDSPPLEVSGVTAEGTVYEVLFFAEGDGEFTLAYSDERAAAPQYDVAAIQTVLQSGIEPQVAALGAEQAAPEAGPRPTTLADLINNPALLISVVVVLLLALGWGLYQAVQRVNSLPPEDKAT